MTQMTQLTSKQRSRALRVLAERSLFYADRKNNVLRAHVDSVRNAVLANKVADHHMVNLYIYSLKAEKYAEEALKVLEAYGGLASPVAREAREFLYTARAVVESVVGNRAPYRNTQCPGTVSSLCWP